MPKVRKECTLWTYQHAGKLSRELYSTYQNQEQRNTGSAKPMVNGLQLTPAKFNKTGSFWANIKTDRTYDRGSFEDRSFRVRALATCWFGTSGNFSNY